jgi:quercetin dioxygenase-like cupin family protein
MRSIMEPKPFVVVPAAYPRGLNVVGETITVLASHADTQGYEIFLQQGAEGSGPPPHSHAWDESFFVTKGSVDITFDDSTTTAIAGSLVHVPAGTMHSFRFNRGGGEMLSVTSPNSQATALFTRIDAEAGPDDIPRLIQVARACGVHIGEA